MKPSRIVALAATSILCLPVLALADTPAASTSGWSGSGELGLANATGNTKSLNADAKFRLGYEDDTWKDAFFLDANRAKSNVKTPIVENGTVVGTTETYQTTATAWRAAAAASSGSRSARRRGPGRRSAASAGRSRRAGRRAAAGSARHRLGPLARAFAPPVRRAPPTSQ